jgi:hypothetical protein
MELSQFSKIVELKTVHGSILTAFEQLFSNGIGTLSIALRHPDTNKRKQLKRSQ